MKKPGIQDILSANGPVEELELDDAFQEHLRQRGTYDKHRVALSEVLQVQLSRPKLFLNSSPTGRAPIIMVGPTDEGRWPCVPVEPTGKWGIWRPVTAFEANAHHRSGYEGG